MKSKNTGRIAANLRLNVERKTKKILLNKKAASVVVSTIILTAGVIAMSIAVLYWTYGMGKVSNNEYSKSTVANSNAVGEKVGFEYISYLVSSGPPYYINAYLINCGVSDNISISNAIILDSAYHYVDSNRTVVQLKSIEGNMPLLNNQLQIGKDGFFSTKLSDTRLASGIYNLRIVTSRGRTFDGSFSVP
jgi:hypothetical protein